MPIITDAELEHYKEKEEENDRLYDRNEDLKESYDKTILHRNILIALASLFLLLLLIGVILKSVKPNLFINKAKLAQKGLSLVSTEEYTSLQEFKENQLINPEAEEETIQGDGGDQASIGDTTVYAVQIGAFINNNIGLFSDSFTQFNEFKKGDFYKYSLGAFETLEEAQDFREKILPLGFDDAFVASFINGERIAIENPN